MHDWVLKTLILPRHSSGEKAIYPKCFFVILDCLKTLLISLVSLNSILGAITTERETPNVLSVKDYK